MRTDTSLPSHPKTQDMASWTRDGIAGLQSVVLYSLPELDGAIDTVVRCTLCCTLSPHTLADSLAISGSLLIFGSYVSLWR